MLIFTNKSWIKTKFGGGTQSDSETFINLTQRIDISTEKM